MEDIEDHWQIRYEEFMALGLLNEAIYQIRENLDEERRSLAEVYAIVGITEVALLTNTLPRKMSSIVNILCALERDDFSKDCSDYFNPQYPSGYKRAPWIHSLLPSPSAANVTLPEIDHVEWGRRRT